MQILSKKLVCEEEQKNRAIDEGRCEARRVVSVTAAIILKRGEADGGRKETAGE